MDFWPPPTSSLGQSPKKKEVFFTPFLYTYCVISILCIIVQCTLFWVAIVTLWHLSEWKLLKLGILTGLEVAHYIVTSSCWSQWWQNKGFWRWVQIGIWFIWWWLIMTMYNIQFEHKWNVKEGRKSTPVTRNCKL